MQVYTLPYMNGLIHIYNLNILSLLLAGIRSSTSFKFASVEEE